MKAKVKAKLLGSLFLGLVFVLSLTISARSGDKRDHQGKDQDCVVSEHSEFNNSTPDQLVGAVSVPGANWAGFDIGWVDEATEKYFVANSGAPVNNPGSGAVEVLDAENDLIVGRITGFYGRLNPNPACAGPDGQGPNGVLVTPDDRLVVADISNAGTGLVKVFNMASALPPYGALTPIATIPVGGTCRADELAYDPVHHIVLVGNPADTPDVSASFISLDTYSLLGRVTFPVAAYPKVSGIEQPVWDSQLHGGRFILNVPGVGLVVLNPTTEAIDTIYPLNNCTGTGLALGPFQKLLVGCTGSGPLQIVNALNGNVIAITDIPNADEVWYDPGDNRFYAPSGAANGGFGELGVIDAETNTDITPLPPARSGVRSVAAFSENNHVFVIWGPPTAGAAPGTPGAADPCNTLFGLTANAGCIAIYTHESEAAEVEAQGRKNQDRH